MEISPWPLNANRRSVDPVAYHVLQLARVVERSAEYDLIHSHCDFRALPFVRTSTAPILSTNHNRLDAPENQLLARTYPEAPMTALSQSQQRSLPHARWLGVCYNGIPVRDFPYVATPGSYLAFVGRLSREKGPLEAIEVAERTGIPLKIAAKVNEWERDYFKRFLRPRIRPPLIEYVGELEEANKRVFLANALALLFPIRWPEPFGMVLIEAMATGTPVLTFSVGAASEIVKDGVTGYLCRDLPSMVERVADVSSLDRTSCRADVALRFSATAMTNAYEAVYDRLVRADPSDLARSNGNKITTSDVLSP
jgi:glycosyltransferase involved in cell wall biosynthesis